MMHLLPRRRLGRRGGVAVLFAIAAVPVLLAMGFGIDAMRAWIVQSRLITALDAAALAGARNISLPAATRDAEVIGMFWANFSKRSGGAGTSLGFLDAVTADPVICAGPTCGGLAEGVIRLTATARVPTTSFAGALPTLWPLNGTGWRYLDVAWSSEARRTDLGMEVALVLDVTGSMGANNTPSPIGSTTTNGTNIDALRLAAGDLVNILYGNRETVNNLWVSVVPYTTTVNIGSQRYDWLGRTSAPPGYAPRSWGGCVEARHTGANDQNDATWATAPFQPFLWPSTLGKYTLGPGSARPGGVVPGDNDWDTSFTGDYGITEMYQDVRGNNTTGPNVGCPQAPILPLTASKTSVLNRILALRSTFKGGTMHNVGLQAGWFTLSQNWRGLWTATPAQAGADSSPATLPLNYGTPFMQKVVVLMTDGVANWHDWGGGAPGSCGDRANTTRNPAGSPPYQPVACPVAADYPSRVVVAPGAPPISSNADYTGYGRLLENRLGIAGALTQTNMTTELNNRMRTLCTTMKLQGIIIYTVTFNLTNTTTQDLFRNCATRPENWFNSPTQADLRTAFQQIGTQLANLRVVR